MSLKKIFPVFQYVFSPITYKLGLREFRKKNWKNAINYFQQSVVLSPEHASSHFKLGICYLKMREFDKACISIDKALLLAPQQNHWQRQQKQAQSQLLMEDNSLVDINLLATMKKTNHIVSRISLHDVKEFFSNKKKSILLVPSDYNSRVLSDILPFVEFYKNQFQVFILLKDIEQNISYQEDYILIKNGTSFGEFLKFTADYVIDAGCLNHGYRITDTNKWASVWHGIPYKKMFSDLDIKHLSTGIRYGVAYDVMISMSKFYTETFLRKAMCYAGEIAEIGCAKADYFFKSENNNFFNKMLDLPTDQKIIFIYLQGLDLDLSILLETEVENVSILIYMAETQECVLKNINDNRRIDVQQLSKLDILFLSDLVITNDEELLSDSVRNNVMSVDCSLEQNLVSHFIVAKAHTNQAFSKIDWKNIFSILPVKSKSLLKYRLGINDSSKVVLYAPTFRKAGSMALPFDPDILLKSLGEDFILITKLHYLNKLEGDFSNVIDLSDYANISDLMKISDILISDYSSLILDYSLLNKPIVLYQYDFESYKDNRGVYFDLNDYVDDSQIVTSENELYNINWSKLSKDTSKLKQEFYPLEKGSSTQNIVNYLNFSCENRKSKDIIFLINELNQIGGIHNFLINMATYYKEKYNSRIFVIAIREFAEANTDVYILDEPCIDFKLSAQYLNGACSNILQNTDGVVISLQFSAHLHFQKHLTNAKSILMFHGDVKDMISREMYGPHLDWLNNEVLYNYEKLLLLTKSNMELLYPHLNETVQSKLGFMPNSIGIEYKEVQCTSSNEFAYIGRLDPDKNVDALIELGKELKSSQKDVLINIYGDGSLKSYLENQIEEYELAPYLRLHGYISDKEEIFNNNKALLLMSKSEGMPLVILEAYAHGKPVIVFDTFTAAKDLVLDGQTGYLLLENDFSSIAQAFSKCASIDPKNIENFFMQFSSQSIFGLWDQIFEDLYD